MWTCDNVEILKCGDVEIWKFAIANICRYADMQICKCANVKMCKCANVQMCKYAMINFAIVENGVRAQVHMHNAFVHHNSFAKSKTCKVLYTYT